MLRAVLRNAGVEKRDTETLGIGITVRIKNGALDGTCTHTLPADNGLLFYSATRAKWPAEPKPQAKDGGKCWTTIRKANVVI